MAKKAKADKTKSEEVTELATSFTDSIVSDVRKQYGDNIMVDGNSILAEPIMTIPISPSLDIITCGGLDEGSWVGITGNPKTGKSGTALCIAATCQRLEYGSRPIYYGKVEGRLSTVMLRGIEGLKLDNFNVIQSQEGRILSAQDYLRIFDNILTRVPKAVLIIDSISALCDQRELEGGVGTETRGSGAKLTSQFLATMSNVVPVNKSLVIGITHLMCNTGNMGAQFIEKATRRWHYQCDYQLRTTGKEAWMAGGRMVGMKIGWKCFNTPRGTPLMQIDSYLRFGKGIDHLFEIIMFSKMAGLITQAKAWFTLSFLASEKNKHLIEGRVEAPKANGAEGVYNILKENPEWEKVLREEVLELATGFSRWGKEDAAPAESAK